MPGFSQPYDQRVTTDGRHHPELRLGAMAAGGVAPAILAIVERGVRRHPDLARSLRMEVEIEMDEGYPPVRVVFAGDEILVEDGRALDPELWISGSLPDLVALMAAPQMGGVPSPLNPRGRAALGMVAKGRIRVQGPISVMRSFLMVIRV
jgi:hypothetical protein